jgi:hypothetical protein
MYGRHIPNSRPIQYILCLIKTAEKNNSPRITQNTLLNPILRAAEHQKYTKSTSKPYASTMRHQTAANSRSHWINSSMPLQNSAENPLRFEKI